MTASKGRVVAVWKTSWLPPSETFIRNQMDALVRWHPQAVGIRRTRSLLSRDSDCVLFETASLRNDLARRALEKTGYSARLNRLIESVGPDVIQAHFGNGGMIIRRSAKKRGVPLVVTLHGTDVTAGPAQRGISGVYYRYRLRRLFRDATLLLPVSNFLASRTIELGADPAKVVVHHIGIPVRDDEIGSTVSREILAVGRLTEKKGFDHLLRAVALLPEDLKHIRVTIIGDGPLRESLERLAHELGVRVAFSGFRTSEEVRAHMSRRPLVCLPSVVAPNGDQEGLPTVAMEAAAEGCAIVAYRHSGMADIVESGSNGILVPEGDVPQLAAALAQVLHQPSLMKEMGEAGILKVRREFDIRHQGLILETLFERAVAARTLRH
jgi:colanic acid/amylovoran biosynthesis glycosyltransferase